jgi:hypothetical protein
MHAYTIICYAVADQGSNPTASSPPIVSCASIGVELPPPKQPLITVLFDPLPPSLVISQGGEIPFEHFPSLIADPVPCLFRSGCKAKWVDKEITSRLYIQYITENIHNSQTLSGSC